MTAGSGGPRWSGADWAVVDALLERALDLEPGEREIFLHRSCPERPDLRDLLRRLIAAAETPEERLEAARNEMMEAALREVLDGDDGVPTGSRVGRYRILREIDRGGMASVYEAERADDTFAQRVAVKVLRRGLDTDDVVARFRAEREILSSLVHPNIAHILDGGSTDDGRPYLVMELVQGLPLSAWVRERDPDLPGRLGLFLQVAEAVRFAHGHLVIHRDLKPANVLVDDEGRVKLLDFGIAKILSPNSRRTSLTRVTPLTPAYASPEQVRGSRMTTASDVFQLGVILFELLTDVPPSGVGEEGAGATFADTAARPSAELRRCGRLERAKRVQGDLDTIVSKATREDPAERYGSVDAFIDDVRRFLADRPIAARPASAAYVVRKFLGRHRWVAPTAAAVILLTTGYVALLSRQADRLAAERDRAEQLADRAGALRALLVGQFDAANPWGDAPERARDITMVEALEGAAARARMELAREPLLLAGILSDVALVYEKLDERRSGMALLEEGIALRESLGEGGSRDQRDDLGLLSDLLVRESLADSAYAVAERVLAMEYADDDPSDERIGTSLGRLARFASGRGWTEEAHERFQEGVDALRRAGADPEELASLLERHAVVQAELGLLDAAEGSIREALEIRRRQSSPDHPSVAVAEEHLAQVLHRAGRLEESGDLHRSAARKLEASLGPLHGTTISTLNNLAVVLAEQGHHETAGQVHRDLLERQLRRRAASTEDDGGGPASELDASIATSMQNLAASLVRQGRLAEADTLSERAGDIFAATFGPTDFRVGFAFLTRAEIALLQGDGPGASELAVRAAGVLEDALPEGHFALAVARCREAWALALMDRHVEAEAAATRAMGQLRRATGVPQRFVEECDATAEWLRAAAAEGG